MPNPGADDAPVAWTVRVVGFWGQQIALFRLDAEHAPFLMDLNEIQEALYSRQLIPVQNPEWRLPASETQLDARALRSFQGARKLMSRLLELEDREDNYDRNRIICDYEYRVDAFQAVAKAEGVSKRTPQRYLYRYLKYGMNELALAGPLKRCDAMARLQKNGKRRGPKPSESIWSELRAPDIREKLKPHVKPYLMGKWTLRASYHVALMVEYANSPLPEQRIRAVIDGKKLTPAEIEGWLLPVNRRPTIDQFLGVADYVRRQEGIEKTKALRELRPANMARSNHGRARHHIHGPGQVYEIDSTGVQVTLRSSLVSHQRTSSGNLYALVDLWSTAGKTIFWSSDHPSFSLASAALRSVLEDKRELFMRLNHPYDPYIWGGGVGPDVLVVDRFEFLSAKADGVRKVGVNFRICRPGEGADKGTIEGLFSQLKHGSPQQLLDLPGKYPKNPQRGEDDGRESFVFTPLEFERRAWEILDTYNAQPVPLADFPPDALGMGLENLSRIELDIWGRQHRAGFGMEVSREEEVQYLMAPAWGTVTGDGISVPRADVYRSGI